MSSSQTNIKACLDVLRRTDPRDTEKVSGLLVPRFKNVCVVVHFKLRFMCAISDQFFFTGIYG